MDISGTSLDILGPQSVERSNLTVRFECVCVTRTQLAALAPAWAEGNSPYFLLWTRNRACNFSLDLYVVIRIRVPLSRRLNRQTHAPLLGSGGASTLSVLQ